MTLHRITLIFATEKLHPGSVNVSDMTDAADGLRLELIFMGVRLSSPKHQGHSTRTSSGVISNPICKLLFEGCYHQVNTTSTLSHFVPLKATSGKAHALRSGGSVLTGRSRLESIKSIRALSLGKDSLNS